jgi:hypothetical protein
VKNSCTAFRTQLRQTLEAPAPMPGLQDLSWNEHLHSCSACRELLAAEEALEALLSSLPSPSLPPGLAQRVLARLEAAQPPRGTLDALLEMDHVAPFKPGLAQRVLAHLAEERALQQSPVASVDALLERARPIDVPSGLAQRTQRALAAHRPTARQRPWTLRLRWALVAAGLALAIGLYVWSGRMEEPIHPVVVVHDAQPDPGLLENLTLLEEWELLQGGDLEVLLSTLSAGDEYLLELDAATNTEATEEGVEPRKG